MGLVDDQRRHRALRRPPADRRCRRQSPSEQACRPDAYQEYIGETVEPWSYLKSAYYAPRGYPDGLYRVGPLARLNVATLGRHAEGRPRVGRVSAARARAPCCSSFHYHYARLIEILYALERIGQILDEPDILSTRVRAHAEPNNLEGIGVAEAPRGTLLHHYKIDEHGLIVWANLIIATGHNNLAMNRGVLQVARHFVDGERLQEGMLNRVEAVIRAYDPCLSCSTHALGKMPLRIQLLAPDGAVLRRVGARSERCIAHGSSSATATRCGRTMVSAGSSRSGSGVTWPGIDRRRMSSVLAEHQLTPELAEPISRASLVIFVDAREGGQPRSRRLPASSRPLAKGRWRSATTSIRLRSCQMARLLYGRCPTAVVISVDGDDFSYGTELSPWFRRPFRRSSERSATSWWTAWPRSACR